jgi:uncharacterized caspase-like protein/TolB-like protein
MTTAILVVWMVCQAAWPGEPGLAVAASVGRAQNGPTLWVLAVGVSRYRQEDLNLRFADSDARAIASALQKQAGGPLYREARTLVLANDEVTRESILDSMSRFLGQAGPDDVAVIFLAGHGVQDRSTGSYYFLPSTATAKNYVTAGVRMTDFDEMLRVVRRNVRGVVLMLDTCHAGALKLAAPHLAALEDPAARLTASEGFFLLAASKPGEESEERVELGHGAFSYALLEGMAGAADADRDGYVSVTELFGYVTREVASLTGRRQHPYYKIEGTDFRLAAVKTGLAKLTPRPSRAEIFPTESSVMPTPVPNTVAVMEFRNLRADPAHDWVGVALRTAFNTELSKVRELNVYAPELIDRTMKIKAIDQLAAAKELGIDRLLTGSFSVVGDAVRIDAHIVYTGSGLQEGSDSVQGGLGEFFDLQKRLVVSMLRRMHVSPPGEARDSAETRTNTDVNAYRLLLESEGEVDEPTPPARVAPASKRPTPERRSLFQAAGEQLASLLISAAHAEPPADPMHSEIHQLLDEYRLALERKDLQQLATLYREFPDKRRDTMRQYFDNARDLRVELADIVVRPHGGDVVVSFTRKDSFVDQQSGKPVRLEVRLTRVVARDGNAWKIAGKP